MNLTSAASRFADTVTVTDTDRDTDRDRDGAGDAEQPEFVSTANCHRIELFMSWPRNFPNDSIK